MSYDRQLDKQADMQKDRGMDRQTKFVHFAADVVDYWTLNERSNMMSTSEHMAKFFTAGACCRKDVKY